MLKDVHNLLTMLGIESTIGYRKIVPDHKDGYDHKLTYYLIIRARSNKDFMEKVGFINKECSNYPEYGCGGVAEVPFSKEVNQSIRSVFKREDLEEVSLGQMHRVQNQQIETLVRYQERFGTLEGFYKKIAEREFTIVDIDAVEDLNIEDDMYDVVETSDHMCLYDMILTHQCHEGHLYGAWLS